MKNREFNREHRRRISRGVSKLSDQQVREIRGFLAAGVAQHWLADRYGVHQGTISNIKLGRFYAHVEGMIAPGIETETPSTEAAA